MSKSTWAECRVELARTMLRRWCFSRRSLKDRIYPFLSYCPQGHFFFFGVRLRRSNRVLLASLVEEIFQIYSKSINSLYIVFCLFTSYVRFVQIWPISCVPLVASVSFVAERCSKSTSSLSIQVIPVVEHPGAVLAAVELTLLVDSVVRYTEGGALPTLGTDYRVAFQITLMCHWNMFLCLFKFREL